jgi:hypothetical protein
MQDKRDILRAARLERALERRGLAIRQQFRGPVPRRPEAGGGLPITVIPAAAAAAVAAAAPLAGISISRGAMSVRKNWYSVAV